MRKFSIFILCFFPLLNVLAQGKDVPIELESFSVNIKAGLFTATTTIQMQFYNPNEKVLDGEYSFSLNEGQVITGFELDISGLMRKGVIVDKQKGRVAYENTIRRRIDPGLLEMTAGNQYRIRVYPMPAKGIRKIRVTISEILAVKGNALQYNLPLNVAYAVKHFTVNATVPGVQHDAAVSTGLLKGTLFKPGIDSSTLHYASSNTELRQPISFIIPLPLEKSIVSSLASSSGTLFAMRIKPEIKSASLPAAKSAVIFWDVSNSASKRNVRKDLEFLDLYCAERKISNLTVVTFSNRIHDTRKFSINRGLSNACRRFLESQIFDGGTQLGSINCNKYATDIFLLFTDGLSNFGSDEMKTSASPINCINSSPAANHTLLREIADKTAGRYIDLSSTATQYALKVSLQLQNRLISVQGLGKGDRLNIFLPQAFDDWLTITGRLDSFHDSIRLSYGDMGVVTRTETVSLKNMTQQDTNQLKTCLLLQQYDLLLNGRCQHGETLKVFSTRNKIVSSVTSLIVLDNVQDYIQFGIEPPADLKEEYKKMAQLVKQREEQRKNEESNELMFNLRRSVDSYNERIKWWDKTSKLISGEVIERKTKQGSAGNLDKEGEPGNNANAIQDPGKPLPNLGNGAALQEVVVVGYGTQRRQDMTGSTISLGASQYNPNASSFSQAFEGRVAGVQVTTQNGYVGGSPNINIRGMRSVIGNIDPLYILDGVPIDATTASVLNMNDIEKIQVIKGVQAAMLYGSRGSNGVIVITSKTGFRNSPSYQKAITKYKDMEDVDYVTELKESDIGEMYKRYLQMKDSLGEEPAFYFDAAELLFEKGDKENALRVLSNLVELDNENHQLLRSIAYMLESWGMYDEAIDVYKKVLAIKEEEPQSYRDLALAYEQKGDHQQAVNTLYKVLTRNWFEYEDRYRGLKSMLLNEMNAIINRYRNDIDFSMIPQELIRPLPVDLRIVIDWNKDETDIDLHVMEPGGEECYYSHKTTNSGGRISEDFTQGYGPEEYEIRKAQKGKYSIQVNYYGDRYQKKQVPSFIKLTIYKNFGREDQTMTVQTLIMDGQTGKIEIGELKY